MSWSPQQEGALKAVRAWLRDQNGAQTFYLAGFAGTGKTTLAKALVEDVKKTVLFGAFTGKASLVLRRKGCEGASTIHSMIYKPLDQVGGEPRFILNPDSDVRRAGLVVIDECSMVGKDLGTDLLSFGTRVLVLGDPAQLPPVKDAGFFTARTPDFMLTEVHRQARDNPIIRLSMDVREGRGLEYGDHGAAKIIAAGDVSRAEVLGADQILVGLNRTRFSYNQRVRSLRGFEGPMPKKGERVVCLKNNRAKQLLNGSLWDVESVLDDNPELHRMLLNSADGTNSAPVAVGVRPEFFEDRVASLTYDQRKKSDEFDFGYALTVHKSQGSQWENVYLFDESGAFREDAAKWLYTGITRAAERITVVM